jgi:hypothetical protein
VLSAPFYRVGAKGGRRSVSRRVVGRQVRSFKASVTGVEQNPGGEAMGRLSAEEEVSRR